MAGSNLLSLSVHGIFPTSRTLSVLNLGTNRRTTLHPSAFTPRLIVPVSKKASKQPIRWQCSAKDEEREEEDRMAELEKALGIDSEIPSTSGEFVSKFSSRAYDLRRNLENSLEASSYDVLEANPWREAKKPVFVLAREENRLFTLRTRRPRSEVENELDLLFGQKGSRSSRSGQVRNSSRGMQSGSALGRGGGQIERAGPKRGPTRGSRFQMRVEDVREGILMFEDEQQASQYCSMLREEGGKAGAGGECLGVAQVQADEIFSACRQSNALAVLFRKGITPPHPQRLQQHLGARKHSLEEDE